MSVPRHWQTQRHFSRWNKCVSNGSRKKTAQSISSIKWKSVAVNLSSFKQIKRECSVRLNGEFVWEFPASGNLWEVWRSMPRVGYFSCNFERSQCNPQVVAIVTYFRNGNTISPKYHTRFQTEYFEELKEGKLPNSNQFMGSSSFRAHTLIDYTFKSAKDLCHHKYQSNQWLNYNKIVTSSNEISDGQARMISSCVNTIGNVVTNLY